MSLYTTDGGSSTESPQDANMKIAEEIDILIAAICNPTIDRARLIAIAKSLKAFNPVAGERHD